nr:hypothetical protein [uncultured Chryseobacterium sp.]
MESLSEINRMDKWHASQIRRIGSICIGVFFLAEAGFSNANAMGKIFFATLMSLHLITRIRLSILESNSLRLKI